MTCDFVPGIVPPAEPNDRAWWFAFVGNQLLVRLDKEKAQIPNLPNLEIVGLQPIRSHYFGQWQGQPCYAAELAADAIAPAGMTLQSLRQLYPQLGDEQFAIAGRAVQLKEWNRTHQYCGHCATPTVQIDYERAKRCPKCGLVNYPRIAPAIIVLISRGEEILLARAPRFPEGMYSVLAGFVEPGESLEATLRREVKEEVGVDVQDIRYFGSQPWPFPHSLMIGFTATYAGGEIVPEPEEIVDAGWFHKDQLPAIPPKPSIARKLIEGFLSSQAQN
jgi:NAD+ diphosphatase